jgi:hypothetical protein
LALFHQRIYEYDENDNLTAEIWLDAYGNLLEKRIYEYYENGYYIIEFWLDENEKVDDKTEYKFDNNHNLIEKIYDNNYGNPSHSFFNYKFDENGNWIVQEEVINNKKYKEVKREISYIDSN